MRQAIASVMFDFINSAISAECKQEILAALQKAAQYFDLESFAISGIPLAHERIDPYLLLNAWPGEWFERYVAENYVHIDPVINHTKIADEAFVWSEALGDRPIAQKSRKLMNEATEFGMIDGFSVPIHTAAGFQAIVTFGGRKVSLVAEEKGALQIISIYAHNKLRSLMNDRAGTAILAGVDITARERECIAWCADGKTDWEMGLILGRSERTVHHTISNAQRKLGVVNRAQLIAESFRLGILR